MKITDGMMMAAASATGHTIHPEDLRKALDSALSASPAGVGVETEDPWRGMDSAPTDGTEFIAVRRWPSGTVDAHVYKYEGHPNYWHCKRDGVCIRPDYQESYLWAPLPAALKGDEQ